MARTRRRPSRASSSRVKADWVYRGIIDVPGDSVDEAWWVEGDLSSYSNGISTLTTGITNARAWVLYDSTNFLNVLVNQYNTPLGDQSVGVMGRAARAEGSGALILRTQGQILVRPSTWALGSVMLFGMRLGVFEQDPQTGSLLLDPQYTMMNASSSWSTAAAVWANTRDWVWERRFYSTFDSQRPSWFHIDVNWKGRRRLKPHQCWALYVEADTGSVNTTWRRSLRSLVADEG